MAFILVPTKRMGEAFAAKCKTCGSLIEQNQYWKLSNSVGLHANNGRCGGRKAITLLMLATAKVEVER